MKVLVRSYEKGVVWRDGRAEDVLGPGLHRLRQRFGHVLEVSRVDVRQRIVLVPNQEVATADMPDVRVSAAATWTVVDPVAWLTSSAHPEETLRLALQLALRDVVGAREVATLATERAAVSAELLPAVAAAGRELGAEVLKAELRDVSLPGELRRAALAVLTARQQGVAALERARGEAAALRAAANGARVLAENPALLQLRTAEAAAAAGGTVVLGVTQA